MAKLNSSSPQFLKPISTRTAGLSGGTATLEAIVTGRPLPLITWHKNGIRILKHGRCQMQLEDSGKCSLVLSGINADDEGEYECRAKNRYGQVSCFGELYVTIEEGVTEFIGSSRQPASQSDEDSCDVTEGKSGLFILIDEGSQDDENSADEMGCKESISASEQIESIIEDLTMGDGSLSLSLGKDGAFVSEADTREELPLDEGKLFKSKALGQICETLYEQDVFEDADDCETNNSLHSVRNPTSSQFQTSVNQQKLALQLHKAAGVQENLHQAFADCGQSTTLQAQDFEMVRTADVGGTWDFHSVLSSNTIQSDHHPDSKSAEASLESFKVSREISSANVLAAEAITRGSERKKELKTLKDAKMSYGSYKPKEDAQKCKTSNSRIPSEERADISRRNTTGDTEPSKTEKKHEKVLQRRRSNSDGGKDSEDGVRYGDANIDGEELEMHSLHQCPWESLEKIWRDSLPTESGEDPLPSDLEIGNDEVFMDHAKEETFPQENEQEVEVNDSNTIGSSQVTE